MGRRTRLRAAGMLVAGLLVLAACRPGPPTALPVPDRFSQLLLNRIAAPREVAACAAPTWELGDTERARLRQYHVTVPLPAGYFPAPSHEPRRPIHIPGFGLTALEEWRENLYLSGPGFHRWARVTGGGTAPGPNASEVMLQLLQLRGFQTFYAAPPWTVAEATECTMRVGNYPARVVTFRLVHTTQPGYWGVAAFWRGAPADGHLSLFGLGPDPAAQAEILAILAAVVP